MTDLTCTPPTPQIRESWWFWQSYPTGFNKASCSWYFLNSSAMCLSCVGTQYILLLQFFFSMYISKFYVHSVLNWTPSLAPAPLLIRKDKLELTQKSTSNSTHHFLCAIASCDKCILTEPTLECAGPWACHCLDITGSGPWQSCVARSNGLDWLIQHLLTQSTGLHWTGPHKIHKKSKY